MNRKTIYYHYNLTIYQICQMLNYVKSYRFIITYIISKDVRNIVTWGKINPETQDPSPVPGMLRNHQRRISTVLEIWQNISEN